MTNGFESGAQKVIPAVLVYLHSGQDYLMLYRSGKKAADVHQGKWNGLGGKCEIGETPFDTAIREVREEAGVEISHSMLNCLGVLQFPNFKPQKKEDWWVTVFRAEISDHFLPGPCPEGELSWIEESRLLSLSLWAGDRLFLPFVLRNEAFFGSIFYEGENVVRSQFSRLPNSGSAPKLPG